MQVARGALDLRALLEAQVSTLNDQSHATVQWIIAWHYSFLLVTLVTMEYGNEMSINKSYPIDTTQIFILQYGCIWHLCSSKDPCRCHWRHWRHGRDRRHRRDRYMLTQCL